MGSLCERAPCGCRTIDALCETSSVFTNSWRVHEALDARCALDVERRSGAFVERILPTWFHLEASLWPSCTRKSSRWRPEHQEDADVKENHKRCNLSQQQHCSAEKNGGAFTMDATRHDGSMVVTSQIPSACSRIQKFSLDHIMGTEERHTKEFVMR